MMLAAWSQPTNPAKRLVGYSANELPLQNRCNVTGGKD